jgi:hypothetical protein
MKESTDLPAAQPTVPPADRRRWSAPRSRLAAIVSPELRAAVRKLDETRGQLLAAVSGPRPPQSGGSSQ